MKLKKEAASNMEEKGFYRGTNVCIWSDIVGSKSCAKIYRFLRHVLDACEIQTHYDGGNFDLNSKVLFTCPLDYLCASKVVCINKQIKMGMKLGKIGAEASEDVRLMGQYILRPSVKVASTIMSEIVRKPNMKYFAGRPVAVQDRKGIWEFYFRYGVK